MRRCPEKNLQALCKAADSLCRSLRGLLLSTSLSDTCGVTDCVDEERRTSGPEGDSKHRLTTRVWDQVAKFSQPRSQSASWSPVPFGHGDQHQILLDAVGLITQRNSSVKTDDSIHLNFEHFKAFHQCQLVDRCGPVAQELFEKVAVLLVRCRGLVCVLALCNRTEVLRSLHLQNASGLSS